MIPEPHRSYLLELMRALGPAAEHFVLAGAQATKSCVPGARAMRDHEALSARSSGQLAGFLALLERVLRVVRDRCAT